MICRHDEIGCKLPINAFVIGHLRCTSVDTTGKNSPQSSLVDDLNQQTPRQTARGTFQPSNHKTLPYQSHQKQHTDFKQSSALTLDFKGRQQEFAV